MVNPPSAAAVRAARRTGAGRAGACLASVLALGAAALVPGTAQARPAERAGAAAQTAAACVTREGSQHTDWTGAWFDHDVVCDNSRGDIRLQSFSDSPVVARMLTTRSWFVCWKTGDPTPAGNSFWYYTQGDEIVSRPSAKGWGYLPANLVHSGSHPAPGVPKCPWALRDEAATTGGGR
ncbi:hypothetical protein AB0I49_13690 [Streptomyces sp. NPDC050617]|uniref:hypothetical protein n=1 Tax=Streptomyces sp. NPDC050617 TaxID=3154628 RepID=UPI00343240B6